MNEHERAAIVQQAVDGDGDALQRLILHYHATLHRRIAAALDTRIRGRIEPDDILQQAYVTAVKKIADCHFDGPGGFYKWLEAIAFSRLKDQQRAWHRGKRDVAREAEPTRNPTTSYPALIDLLVDSGSTPSRRVARREACAAVMSSLARLTDDQREVIRLRFLESLPVTDVARRMGKTEPAIHMLCHRGLKALRQRMESITPFLTHV